VSTLHSRALRYLGLSFALVALCALAPAMAQPFGMTLGAHLYSLHAPQLQQRNANVGVYLRSGDWTTGAYRNSLGRLSLYATHAWPLAGPVELHVGLVTGYQRVQVTVPCESVAERLGISVGEARAAERERRYSCWEATGHGRFAIAPMASLSTALPTLAGVTPRLTYVPPLRIRGLGVSRSHVLHLSIEGRF
jgi:hypothetical protein